jgi:L,D-peptidoglycan transpeptidase YkuD (ErfK/YbiS/YcfS/YnhG family)
VDIASRARNEETFERRSVVLQTCAAFARLTAQLWRATLLWHRVFVAVMPLLLSSAAGAADLDGARQIVVATAPSWDAFEGSAQRFERAGGGWKAAGNPWAVLYGKRGLAWGSGVHGQEEKGLHKVENDGRAPAGVFRIGTIYTYDRALPPGSDYPFHTVTAADAWIDDVNHPKYNQHVIVDPANPPPWYARQRMRLGDFAYRWLVELRHNADPPVPGQGSAIFFHLRRAPHRPSVGCTVMAEPDLVTLIRWLRADAKPHFVLLPRSEYTAKWKAWGLPSPDVAGALLK